LYYPWSCSWFGCSYSSCNYPSLTTPLTRTWLFLFIMHLPFINYTVNKNQGTFRKLLLVCNARGQFSSSLFQHIIYFQSSSQRICSVSWYILKLRFIPWSRTCLYIPWRCHRCPKSFQISFFKIISLRICTEVSIGVGRDSTLHCVKIGMAYESCNETKKKKQNHKAILEKSV